MTMQNVPLTDEQRRELRRSVFTKKYDIDSNDEGNLSIAMIVDTSEITVKDWISYRKIEQFFDHLNETMPDLRAELIARHCTGCTPGEIVNPYTEGWVRIDKETGSVMAHVEVFFAFDDWTNVMYHDYEPLSPYCS